MCHSPKLAPRTLRRCRGKSASAVRSSLAHQSAFAACFASLVLPIAGCGRPPRRTEAGPVSEDRGAEVRIPASDLKPPDVAALEAVLEREPDNVFVRDKLLVFYRDSGDRVVGRQATVEGRRRHILWLIQHRPASKSARAAWARILTLPTDPDPDPVGYSEARNLWLAQTAESDAPIAILNGAARFFRVSDKPLAEKMLLRAQALEPKGRWSGELGRLYYEVLVGATAITPQGAVSSIDRASAHSAYAKEIRDKLTRSGDAALLIVTAESLGVWGRKLYRDHAIDFDAAGLANIYLAHALQLDPQSIPAHQVSNNIRFAERGGQVAVIPPGATPDAEYRAAGAMPPLLRYVWMSLLAGTAYAYAEDMERRDKAAARAARETARQCARDALRLAPQFRDGPDYGTAVYNARIVLGLLALQAGDRSAAIRCMMDASAVPPTEELAYSPTDFGLKLPQLLYQAGERNSVAAFLERFAQINVSERGYLRESAKAIRGGGKPLWVQQ